MTPDERRSQLDQLTETILSAAFEVSNTLGAGFLEKVYQRALLRELTLRKIKAIPQARFQVVYKTHLVGEYFADLLVENAIVLELKCTDRLTDDQMAQCLNYLHAANMTVCLLINFQNPTLEWKRIVQDF